MMLTTVRFKLYEDEEVGVVDQDVESDPSSDHLTLQAVAPVVVDQDADSFRQLGSVL